MENKKILDGNLNTMTEEELKAMRKFLFEERIRIMNEKNSLEEMRQKLQNDRNSYKNEMESLNLKIVQERQRLKQEELFFEKKFQILQNGFVSLDMDRKAFEREKAEFEANKNATNRYNFNGHHHKVYDVYENVGDLFAGVKTYLGLKKRYKDLLKIFHPDNLDGDKGMVIAIKDEYERLVDLFM